MKYLFFVLIILSAFITNAQQAVLKTVKVGNFGKIIEIEIEVRTNYDTFSLKLDGYGQILSLELLKHSGNINIEFYDRFAEPEIVGKFSCLNLSKVKYYQRGGTPDEIVGKISEIGNVKIDYYYADPDKSGRIYYVGNLVFNYYTRSNDESVMTRISRIGNIEIEYFTSYSDLELKGYIRKIGNFSIEYYTQYDDASKSGKIKKVTGSDTRFKLITVL